MSDFREELIEAMAQDLRHRMGLSSAAFDHDHPLPGLACTPEFLMECALAVAESFRQTVECPECGGTGRVDLPSPTTMVGRWAATSTIAVSGPCSAGCIDGRVPNQTRLAIVEVADNYMDDEPVYRIVSGASEQGSESNPRH